MWQYTVWALVVIVLAVQPSDRPVERQETAGETRARSSGEAPQAHQTEPCSGCHLLPAEGGPAVATAFDYRDQCLSCHESASETSNGLSQLFHRRYDQTCSRCHFYHNPAQLQAGGRQFAFPTDERIRYICAGCHNETGLLEDLSPGHRAAGEFYHSDAAQDSRLSPSASCMTCHGDAHIAKDPQTPHLNPIPINLLASHPVEIPMNSVGQRPMKQPIDPRISLLDGTIECQSCHLLTSGADFALVKFNSTYDLCLGCHDHTDPLGPAGLMAEQQ